MKPTLLLVTVAALHAGSAISRADYLPNNFWPNAAFETGTNLDATDGTAELTGWVRSGSDPAICQVTTNNWISGTHSIMVNDNDAATYGEWDYNLSLAGLANPGDALNLRYYQMYSVSGGEMRVTVLFFDANTNLLFQTHYTVMGNSPGWNGTIATSTFTRATRSLAVPARAAWMQVAVVSGGPSDTTGVLVVDDFSVARTPIARLLSGNFWPNSNFESGTNLNNPDGIPSGWTAGGALTSICQVTTNNYTSTGHALMVDDADPTKAGKWSSDLALGGLAAAGDILNFQWFELYSIQDGQMRFSASFLDTQGNAVQQTDFSATGQSAGWQGAVAGSGFTQRNESLTVPPGAATLRWTLASGVTPQTVGVMIIDDLSVARPTQPVILSGNFWPNPRFEQGTALDTPTGLPNGWTRVGGDITIPQVITNNYGSPRHALALLDANTNAAAEWDSDVILSTNAAPLDVLDIQYSELHSVTNGAMRLSALFYDGGSNLVSQTDFAAASQSAGWQGAISRSSFTLQKQQVMVPNNAAWMRLSAASGPDAASGVLVIDDVSVARRAVPPSVLAGNFFPNPTFEDGSQLDDPTLGVPAGGWQMGGNNSSIDQVTTNNSVSPTHALALVDNDANVYGEWYTFINLAGLVTNLDAVDVQWFQISSTTNGSMRLSFAFLDTGGNSLSSKDFPTSATGQSAGWTGSVAASSFEPQFQRLEVPAGATQLRVNFASGGSQGVTGVTVLDDLSVRLSKPMITGGTVDSSGFTVTWNSMSSRTYKVLFSRDVGPGANWTVLTSGLSSAGLSTSYSDASFSGQGGFYRVVQE